jgi:cytochrome c553
MKPLRTNALLALGALLSLATQAQQPAPAADIGAGRARAEAVCAACHGANGISVSDTIPHLAGQRAAYLESQLRALKDGSRKAPVMNAMATQLGPEDIRNLAAFFASLPGAAAGGKSAFMAGLAATPMRFPEGYDKTFTKYHTINFPATRQVRHYYANAAALQAAKAGQPVPDGAYLIAEVWSAKLDADKKPVTGADGFYVADQLLFYTAMAREAGWGAAVPEMLRNENWNYAAFTAAKAQRAGVNQAECLACHKPLDKTSFMFTLEPLVAAAKR